MFVYILYFFTLLFLLLVEQKFKKKRFIRAVIALLYACLIGLRGEKVGVDTEHYIEHYYTYGAYGCDFIEPGFDWINRFVYSLNWGPTVFLSTFAFLSMFFIYLALDKLEGRNYTIAALCFYILSFYPYINIMRQMVAMSIFVFSIRFIIERKIICYTICILFAFLFHASAVILLPLYFLKDRFISKWIYIIIYLASFIFVFIDTTSYIPMLSIEMRDYGRYVSDDAISDFSFWGYFVTTILHVIVLYCMCANDFFRKYPLLSNLVFIYFCIYNIGIHVPIILRIGIYFQFFIYLMYPLILLKGGKFFMDKTVTALAIFSINAALWLNSMLTESLKMFPYHFFWQH